MARARTSPTPSACIDRGLPELHLWARPSLGDDPGADWMFSPRDCFVILNDAGLAAHRRPRWRSATAGSSRTTTAWSPAASASTHRATATSSRRSASCPAPRYCRCAGRCTAARSAGRDRSASGACSGRPRSTPPSWPVSGDDASVPDGWTLPPAFEPGGEFGPLTPMVAARVAELWSADAITLGNLLWAATTMLQGGSITWPVATARRPGARGREGRRGRPDEGRRDRRRRGADGPAGLAADGARARRRHRLRAGRGQAPAICVDRSAATSASCSGPS